MIVTVHDLFCDLCGNWIQGAITREGGATESRRRGKEKGWTRRRVDGKVIDVCPTCDQSEQERVAIER